MEYSGNLQIHCKGKVGDKEIDFTLDLHVEPAALAQPFFNEMYIEPALVQVAQELEFRLVGTSSDWGMTIGPLELPPENVA
jgi:hypothetical protein